MRLFISTARTLRRLLVVTVMLLAVLVTAVRVALPFADGLRAELEQAVGETLGLDVSVERLRLRWSGLHALLELHQATLRDPEDEGAPLRLERLVVQLDLVESFQARAPRLREVVIAGIEVSIQRTVEGKIEVSGLDLFSAGGRRNKGLFARKGRLILEDSLIRWVDARRGAPPVELRHAHLLLRNDFDRHDIRARAEVAGGELTLSADLRGAEGRPESWSGDLYLAWAGRDLGRLLGGQLPPGWSTDSEGARIEIWGELRKARLPGLTARLSLDGFELGFPSVAEETARISLTHAAMLLRYEDDGAVRRLLVDDLSLRGSETQLPAMDLRVLFDTVAERLTLELGAVPLDSVRQLARAARLLPRPDEGGPGWLDLPIDGAIEGLTIGLATGADVPQVETLSGRIQGFGRARQGGIAGVQGINLTFRAGPRSGTLELDSQDVVLDVTRLFRAPFELDELGARLRWQYRPERQSLRIIGDRIRLTNADVTALGELRLCLPLVGGDPFVDLRVTASGADAAAAERYIPYGILKDNLSNWLDRAIVSGQASKIDLILRGRLSDFPFDDGLGAFRLQIDIDDGVLDYTREWPRLEGLAGRLRFVDRSLEVDIERGRLAGAEVEGGRARIANVWNPRLLRVHGQGHATVERALAIVQETPLRRRLGKLASNLDGSGDVALDLELDVPLKRRDGKLPPIVYRGALGPREETKLRLVPIDLDMPWRSGRVQFDGAGVRAKDVRSHILGGPARLQVSTKDARTHIDVGLHPSKKALQQRFPMPYWGHLRGSSDWRLGLWLDNTRLQEDAAPLELALSGDLVGLQSRLPAPLTKAAKTPLALRLQGELRPGDALELSGSAGGGKLRVVQRLGAPRPGAAEHHLIALQAAFERLDLFPWLMLDTTATGATGAAATHPLQMDLDLELGEVHIGETPIAGVSTKARVQDGAWQIGLTSATAAGRVSVPGTGVDEPVRIGLERLDLTPWLAEGGRTAPAREQTDEPAPGDTPPVELAVEQLTWGERNLGSAKVSTASTGHGIALERLRLDGPLIRVAATGSWNNIAGESLSRLQAEANGSDVDALMRALGLETQIDAVSIEASLSLEWPGGPGDFALESADGSLAFELGEGRLLEVDPGVGRLLGVVNLAEIQKRITLDFRDVVEPGLQFDAIDGRVAFRDGKADIRRFVLNSSTADVRVSGSANLLDKTVDQVAEITPKIGSGVAIAGAVAGGPLVGAAVYVVDKLSGGGVDRLGRYSYRIEGPWEAPDIELIGATAVGQGTLLGGDSGAAPARAPSRAGAAERPAPKPELSAPAAENLFLDQD